jgi:uncharacterized protein YecE (DUF72 family)
MSRPDRLFHVEGLITAPFTYLRWLGDRAGMETLTKVWDKVVIDRASDLDEWVPHIKELLDRQVRVFGYVNNHYSGHAPENVAYLEQRLTDPVPADSR